VLASSVFEHDPTFWHTFSELCRITKPGGHIYVSAPANGVVHRFPQDCWRFYPDAGVALAGWGQRSGFEVTLIESFVADQGGELWNDFVAVFVRGPAPDPLPAEFMYSAFSARNIRRLGQDELIEPRALVEDQDLIASAARALIALEQRAATSGAIPRTDAHMRAMQGFARNSDPGHYGDGDFTGEKPNNPFAESYTILDSALTALTAERDQLRAELSSIHEHLRRGLLRRAIRRLRRSVFG
jgi:hypothetical protein